MIFATFRTLLLLCIFNNQRFPPARYFIPAPTGLKYLPLLNIFKQKLHRSCQQLKVQSCSVHSVEGQTCAEL